MKKIVWVCNKRPDVISRLMNLPGSNFGGWIDAACQGILADGNTELSVLFPDTKVCEAHKAHLHGYGFEETSCGGRIEQILQVIRPDLIHIWGTEFRHTYETVLVCEKMNWLDRTVVSIQGLVSVIGTYHYAEGIPHRILRRFTLRDFLTQDNIEQKRQKFIKRGRYEVEALRKARHIIGRTEWDKAAAKRFNPNARYHFCNESLRDSFYGAKWDAGQMEPYRIFASQCSYPVKGFHYLLEAMPDILREHPNAQLFTTGLDLLHLSLRQKLKLSSYQKYLRELIHRYHLEAHVHFLGNLTEKEMCGQYLRANVFVSPSTIENSSNSVGEAMLVGCPVVSSSVGGIQSLIDHGREGLLYQSAAPYMLAYYVNKLLDDREAAVKLSEQGRSRAEKTHDRKKNMETLIRIYEEIEGK